MAGLRSMIGVPWAERYASHTRVRVSARMISVPINSLVGVLDSVGLVRWALGPAVGSMSD